MNDPALSIVVIGRNEGARLTRCLESVGRLRGIDGEKEVIYVDSASTDGSPQTAARLDARVICLGAGNPTAARARNAGWAAARAPFLLFLDGDTILDPHFPRTALDALVKDASIAAVWGHRREIHPDASIYNRVLDLDWIYPPGETPFCGGDALMRKSALAAAGGYDPTLIAGEEPELCRRMRAQGSRILHIDAPMAGHDLNMLRFSQYWRRSVRAGHAYAEISTRYRSSDDPMWVAESNGNILRGGFLLLSLAAALAFLALSVVPLIAWIAMFAALSARSAWRARWRSPKKPALLLLYGFHSQLQQIPILFGQLKYFRDRRSGRLRKLIEYKEDSRA